MHIITEVKHEKQKMAASVMTLAKTKAKQISDDRNHLLAFLESFVDPKTGVFFASSNIEHMFRYMTQHFHSLVDDSILGFVAINLKSYRYAQTALRNENGKPSSLQKKISQLKKHRLSQYESAVEFALCFALMPYESAAFAYSHAKLITEFRLRRIRNQSRSLIAKYQAIVKSECKPEAARAFLDFFSDYLAILERASQVLKLNSSIAIYNKSCVNAAAAAYSSFCENWQELSNKS